MQIPRTQITVSYAYTIKANGKRIGTIQSFTSNSQRALYRVREIANDSENITEIAPGRADFTISVERIELYTANMIDALGYDILGGSIAEIRDPIQIIEQWIGPDNRRRSVIYDRCWINTLGKSVREGQIQVVETATLWPERIFTQPIQ